MRIRLDLACMMVAAVLTAPAALGETLTEAIQADALRLKPKVEAARAEAARRATIRPAPLAADLVDGLHRFGFNTARLATEIDARRGAADLRCIFRGMAEETDVQLKAAATAPTGAQQAAALLRLSGMLRDAAEIVPAANANAASAGARAAFGSCPAEIRP